MTDDVIPAGVAISWGLRPAPSRGPRRELSIEAMVRAGIELADDSGLAAVSMSRIARSVGAPTMSLYRYVTSKDELVVLMADRALDEAPTLSVRGWRERTLQWGLALHDRYHAHPWLLTAIGGAVPESPQELAWWEIPLAALAKIGLNPLQRTLAVSNLVAIVRGQAAISARLATGPLTLEGTVARYRETLTLLTADGLHPQARSLLDEGVFDAAQPPVAGLRFALERYLDGLAAFLSSADGRSTATSAAGER